MKSSRTEPVPLALDARIRRPETVQASVEWARPDGSRHHIIITSSKIEVWWRWAHEMVLWDQAIDVEPGENTVNAHASMIDYLEARFGVQQGLPPRKPGTQTLNPSHLLNFSFSLGSKAQNVTAFESRIGSFLQDSGFEASPALPGSAPRTDVRNFLKLMGSFSESEAIQIKQLLPARRASPARPEALRLAESLVFGVSTMRWNRYHLEARAGVILELCPDLNQLDPAARGLGRNPSQWLMDLVCCSLMNRTLHTVQSKPWVPNSLAMAVILARQAPPQSLLVADGREFLPVTESNPGTGVRPWLAGTSPAAAGDTLIDVLLSDSIMEKVWASPLHEVALAFDALLAPNCLPSEQAHASVHSFFKHCLLKSYPNLGLPDGSLDEPLAQTISAFAHASFSRGLDLQFAPESPVLKSIHDFCPKALAALEHAEISHAADTKSASKRALRV